MTRFFSGFFRLSFSFSFFLVLTFAPLSASGASITEFWSLAGKRDWARARAVAAQLDKKHGKGDIFVAYADSLKFLQEGRCDRASPLAQIVVRFEPGFLAAYDIIAACLVKEGKRAEAQKLVHNIARQLDEGAEKEYYVNWSNRLNRSREARLSVNGSLTPSTNVTRRTSRRTGLGGILTEDSRAKKGIIAYGQVQLTKPLFSSEKRHSQVSISPSFAYDTATELSYPTLGLSTRTTWRLDAKNSVYIEPHIGRTWANSAPLFDEMRLGGGLSRQIRPDLHSLSSVSLAKRNFTNSSRNAFRTTAQQFLQYRLDEDNKVSSTARLSNNNAKNRFYDEKELNLSLEWEHRFDSGFITSLGGTVGFRRFKRTIPLSAARRKDNYRSVLAGVSHEKVKLFGYRPQLTYQGQKQNSNDIFNDFDAHSATVLFKRRF